jgi:tRNA(Ile)-lysidine synthase
MFSVNPIVGALTRAAERDLMPPGASVLLAVSGGADSMALFSGCLEVARETGWRLAVAHVHHGLRGREADRDLAFVREQARRAGLPFFFRRREAASSARALGISPEAGARLVRYDALREMAREAGADRIAVAHQKGDVAESHLLARSRRGGVCALAGPRERRADGVVRPLLAVSREEILAYLEARGVGYRRDSSNGDLRFDRNRVRRELAKASQASSSDPIEDLAREAGRHAARRDHIEGELERNAAARFARAPGLTIADALWLQSCPRELARRALAEAATPFARPGRPAFTGRERERLLDLLAAGGDFRFEAGRRIRFERRGSLLRVLPSPAPRPRVDTAGRPA